MVEFFNQICPNVVEYFPDLLKALNETLLMVSISGIFCNDDWIANWGCFSGDKAKSFG